MPVIANFQQVKFDDGALIVTLTPPVAVGGWTVQWQLTKRAGGTSGLITGSVASGFNAQSGINITDSGKGVFNVTIPGLGTSGLEYGEYYYNMSRLDSGARTVLAEGYLSLVP